MNNLSKWKISSYLAAIFLAGVVAGAVGSFKAGRRMMFTPPRPEDMAARVCDEFQSKLNLTPEQARKVRGIINEGMTQFQSVVGQEIRAAFSNSNVRVAAELTAEQRVKFAEIQKEHEKFLNHGFKGAPKDAPGDSKKTP